MRCSDSVLRYRKRRLGGLFLLPSKPHTTVWSEVLDTGWDPPVTSHVTMAWAGRILKARSPPPPSPRLKGYIFLGVVP